MFKVWREWRAWVAYRKAQYEDALFERVRKHLTEQQIKEGIDYRIIETVRSHDKYGPWI